MTEIDEMFWDAAITEAATKRGPPDQTARILARIDEAPARKRRWWRYPVELAAAAALVVAIGVATGLIRWPDEQAPQPEASRTWAAGPESAVVETDAGLRFEQGWLLLQPGAPDVQCGESRLTEIDGLVLAHAGGEPTESEFQTVQPWLQHNQVEAEMFTKAKWVAGLAMAVMVFQGSAVLDGQEVDGEPKPAPVEPEWVTVRNVMDIEKLPEGTKHVRADNLSAKYLEFLAEVPSIESLSFRDGEEMTAARLKALTELHKLSFLDLQGTDWAEQADYGWLMGMNALRRLVVDVLPDVRDMNSGINRGDEQAGILARLKQLVEKGIELTLGEVDATSTPVTLLLKELPGLTRLHVDRAGDADLTVLLDFKKLQWLDIEGYYSDVGLAHLAKHRGITHLSCELHSEPSEWYQIGKMTWLKQLSLERSHAGQKADECFSQLAPLADLSELDLGWLDLPRETYHDETSKTQRSREVPYPASSLASLPKVPKLLIDGRRFTGFWAQLPRLRAQELVVDWGELRIKDFASDNVVANPDSELESLTIVSYNIIDSKADLAAVSRTLTACPKLKRIRIRYEHYGEDENAQALIEALRKAAPNADVQYEK
jgi:hypothetical protein